MKLSHKFVKNIPDQVEEGVLYISIEYATAIHKCCCGCGNQVVTPLSPTDWKMSFNGQTVSLYPSIGSWDLPCRSHYWITADEIEWAENWSREKVNRNKDEDRKEKEKYYSKKNAKKSSLFERLFGK